MSTPDPAPVSPDMEAALRRRLPAGEEILRFDTFMDCALFDPRAGYYTRERHRVGHDAEADFYTSASLGKVFSELLLEALRSLLGPSLEPFTFVEIGPEHPDGILGRLDSPPPFRDTRLILPGDPLEWDSPAIVFANEVLDARPFRRFIRDKGHWKELGVRLLPAGIAPVLLDAPAPPESLPESLPDGYTIDWPAGAHDLLQRLTGGAWKGLFLTFDYGLPLATAFSERPRGTGRTYHRHTAAADLLADPGQRDITCHLLWEPLEAILTANGFKAPALLTQEAFFMRHAQPAIRRILESTAPGLSRQRQTLKELLHPGNLGHAFKALFAQR
jgi:SAM-dependent MidA family methyltransferase